jgi:sugar-specific transcriptional regulator TrmB
VSEISNKAKMPRTSVDHLLKSLKSLNFVGQLTKKGVLVYSAVGPTQISKMLELKKESYNDIMPELQALSWKKTSQPNFRLFEGKNGIITAMNELLDDAQKDHGYRVFGSLEIFNIAPKFFNNFTARRIKEKIFIKNILPKSTVSESFVKMDHAKELRDLRLLSGSYSFPATQAMTNRKIYLFPTEGELFSLIIENDVLARAQQSLFDALWDRAEKIN